MKTIGFLWRISLPLVFLACYACKQEGSATETRSAAPSPPAATQPPAEKPVAEQSGNPNLVANMSWTFLTDKLFQNRATVVSGQGNDNPNQGHWIDFNPDGTYTYGVWGEKTVEGTWTYDDDTQLLEMMPSSGNQKRSEWTVKYSDDKLVLVGTATYGDNAYQEMWIRVDHLPDKNAKPRSADEDDE